MSDFRIKTMPILLCPKIQIILILIAAFFSACASQTSVVNRGSTHRDLADDYYRTKEYRKAKHELLIILKKNPDDVESNFRLGVIYGKEGSIKESQAAFEKVLSLDPKYSKAYFNLGVLYSKGESEDCLKISMDYFESFLQLEPNAKQKQKIKKWKLNQVRKLDEYKSQ